MSRSDRKKWDKATAKSDARRKVFSSTCACRRPTVQSAVHNGLFCMACWHPVIPAKSASLRHTR